MSTAISHQIDAHRSVSRHHSDEHYDPPPVADGPAEDTVGSAPVYANAGPDCYWMVRPARPLVRQRRRGAP